MTKPVVFTRHAEVKIAILKQHGFSVDRRDVTALLQHPERIRAGHGVRKVAERKFNDKHLLRVVFEESPQEIKVITLYPARRDRYEA